MSSQGMIFIIPPLFEPTVPLLGPIQLEGYAKSIGYNFVVHDLNNMFVQYMVEFAIASEDKHSQTSNPILLDRIHIKI